MRPGQGNVSDVLRALAVATEASMQSRQDAGPPAPSSLSHALSVRRRNANFHHGVRMDANIYQIMQEVNDSVSVGRHHIGDVLANGPHHLLPLHKAPSSQARGGGWNSHGQHHQSFFPIDMVRAQIQTLTLT
jgi:hypothetical protein